MESDDTGLPQLTARLAESVELVKRGDRHVFDDGRAPMYFALLDLPSKPFWKAHECDGGT
jgi:hypothetical protein